MGNSMTKSELLAELYGRLPTFRDTMSQTLVEGGRIEIRGFGSFGLKYRPERVGRNPQDGSAVAVRARYTVFFKAGKDLRQRVDASRDSKL